ncbi:hypothetical protein TSUD_76430 [Trifolium subterraneum]|uniref:monodehydroascorbate reductase (NADH) n=1 Tax=Trifolium subterraneum TaxID=3900 RepID=A0A2Z6MAM6_TRISU|nr:hypothetical protein TSUD_76430 [Trifolium subterraneum]
MPSSVRRLTMAVITNSLSLKHTLSLGYPQRKILTRPSSTSLSFRRCYASYANENREYVIVGGGNAAGYAARTFVEHGVADGRLCIVTKEGVAPYERPALTKAYLFPPEKKPARLPMLYEDPVENIDIQKQTLTTSSGKLLKYGSLIIATGCTSSRFPDKIGGNLSGVHYIRDVADADSLVSSLIIFPDDHFLQRLFTPSLARRYEELYQKNGVKILKGASIKNLEASSNGNGRVAAVKLEDGSIVEADTVIIGIGSKPAVGPFEKLGLNTDVGGIQVDGQFRTSIPGIFAVGDVAAFPLKIYDRISRVEHVDHARRSAQHCVKALLSAQTSTYDYLPYFYSRVFEYEGSTRKVWWQFFGDNVGETVEIGNFDPKIATFWIESGKLKGVLVESGSPEEFKLLPELARRQPPIDKAKLQNASSVEEALDIARGSLQAAV